MKRLLSFLTISILCIQLVSAGGPKKIAKSNRSLWPYAINSATEFDFASKMEMLVFVAVLQDYEKTTNQDSLKNLLGVEKIDNTSISNWKALIKKVLLSNFVALGNTSPHDFTGTSKVQNWQQIISLSSTLKKSIPDNLKSWFINATDFYDTYIYEQLRLAALFPSITSEILILQQSEVSGFNYRDKEFLLTFDDGPTVAGGSTDKLISTLNKNNINGIFFVLGDMFNTRLKAGSPKRLNDLYKPMIVGSHGKVHKPHQRYDDWQLSLSFTNDLIDSIIPENKNTKYFRPPYGQRNDKMISYLNQHNGRVMLWNIDSQDWNAKITSGEVADRVITLMLLWRKGIILFHDIHPKANLALPIIWNSLNSADIHWMDPKHLNKIVGGAD